MMKIVKKMKLITLKLRKRNKNSKSKAEKENYFGPLWVIAAWWIPHTSHRTQLISHLTILIDVMRVIHHLWMDKVSQMMLHDVTIIHDRRRWWSEWIIVGGEWMNEWMNDIFIYSSNYSMISKINWWHKFGSLNYEWMKLAPPQSPSSSLYTLSAKHNHLHRRLYHHYHILYHHHHHTLYHHYHISFHHLLNHIITHIASHCVTICLFYFKSWLKSFFQLKHLHED